MLTLNERITLILELGLASGRSARGSVLSLLRRVFTQSSPRGGADLTGLRHD